MPRTFNARQCLSILKRRGASAVEFALVAPVFLLFVFGLIEVGRAMMIQHSITNACREGSRKAALATTVNPGDVETTVRNHLRGTFRNPFDSDVIRVSTPSKLASVESGDELTVTVEVDFSDVNWLPNGIKGFSPTLGAKSTQQRE